MHRQFKNDQVRLFSYQYLHNEKLSPFHIWGTPQKNMLFKLLFYFLHTSSNWHFCITTPLFHRWVKNETFYSFCAYFADYTYYITRSGTSLPIILTFYLRKYLMSYISTTYTCTWTYAIVNTVKYRDIPCGNTVLIQTANNDILLIKKKKKKNPLRLNNKRFFL